jgi:hypothetical protein
VNKPPGGYDFADLQSDRCKLNCAEARIARLEGALHHIVDPLAQFQKDAEEQGKPLDAARAALLSVDPRYLKSVADAALKGVPSEYVDNLD